MDVKIFLLLDISNNRICIVHMFKTDEYKRIVETMLLTLPNYVTNCFSYIKF